MALADASLLLHLACAIAYAALAALALLKRPVSATGRWLIAACSVTVIWALCWAVAPNLSLVPLLETAMPLAWCGFLAQLNVRALGEAAPKLKHQFLLVTALLSGAALAAELALLVLPTPSWAALGEIVLRIAIAVAGVLLLENLYRNADAAGRWNLKPVLLALLGLFAFEIVLYADTLLFRRMTPGLVVARAPIAMMLVPLLALGAARNRGWKVDIHVSRDVVFHSATLMICGGFLLGMAALGGVVRALEVEWGPMLEAVLLFAAVVVVAIAVTSGVVRSRLKAIVARNFFSHRYDWRQVWLGYLGTLSDVEGTLQARIIRAVADPVDSPGGWLWLRDGSTCRCVATWNEPMPPAGGSLPAGFLDAFRNGAWILDLERQVDLDSVPPVLRNLKRAWAAVALAHGGQVLGFVVLAQPRAASQVDFETYDLLRVLALQTASYVAEEQTSVELADARRFEAYGKRFAFVVHDLKNVVSQLSLMLRNAETYRHDPAFQADVIETVAHAVQSMNKTLAQLRQARSLAAAECEPASIVRAVAARRAQTGATVRVEDEAGGATVALDAAQFERSLEHLIDNALEVSPDGIGIDVRLEKTETALAIEVIDRGRGMAPGFVATELFRPFRSTKGGHGIGAYQVRETARAAGGDLVVVSEPGVGTTMRLVLPRVGETRMKNENLAVAAALPFSTRVSQ
ncbi:XrtA/PEP-CTERM system histidine kinase PrsK [Roseiterribacter gracilis]|uniref:histidine kinase n=1 Tax=Roseiterribacter gracilis TaxID=2812848 RepID=A0A8S8X6S3_9PROT|nr:histidine kinase [Rhodospirillales bacterium TMPK1]